MENEVRALSITVENVKGLAGSHELRLGKPIPGKGRLITLIGDNGVGKTSWLMGIEGLLSGGHRTDLIRDGADKARMSMLLSDGAEIERTITQKGSYPKVKVTEGVPPKAVETYFKSLASGYSFNPLLFCDAKKEERLTYLLKVMPLEFSSAEIFTAAGAVMTKCGMITAGNDPAAQEIKGLDKLIRDLIERRGQIGTRRDEKSDTVESLRKTLLVSDQADDPKDWKAELKQLEDRKAVIEKERDSDVALIEAQIRDVRKSLSIVISQAETQARDEFMELLRLANAAELHIADKMPVGPLRSALADLAVNKRTLMDAEREAQAAIDNTRSVAGGLVEALSGEIATAKSGAEEQIRSGAIREQMEKLRKEAKALSADWDAVAAAIKALGELRRSKLTELPVAGLEVAEDGSILVNGRDFDELNEAARIVKAMEIAAAGVGDLGLIVLDEAERLGPTNWDWVEEAVIESGLTVIAARVASREEVKQFGPGLRSEPASALVTA